ncbi:hypothetical protein BCR42DRAFT_491211 [Absidia repens]|uniref:Uncharacterized protein n=1 Tax=Absidia repens TaxID=90262 RepID=A0A1X2IIW3_9FUNG|nr:hypothetical protein BCR42DRAFT_491211 [Absidia repens]
MQKTPLIRRIVLSSASIGQKYIWQQVASYSIESFTSTGEQEIVTGIEEVHEFMTETKRSLNIEANSLYSEKEIYDNALCTAAVLDDPRSMISRLSSLLEISVNKSMEQDKNVTGTST